MNQKGLWVIDKILHCVTILLNFYCLHFGLAPQRDRIYSLKKKKNNPKEIASIAQQLNWILSLAPQSTKRMVGEKVKVLLNSELQISLALMRLDRIEENSCQGCEGFKRY